MEEPRVRQELTNMNHRREGGRPPRRLGRLLPGLMLFLAGCVSGRRDPPDPLADWRAWQGQRQESVAGTNGWSTITGLHWLGEGRHSVGPRLDDPIRIASGGHLGEFVRTGGSVRFHPANSGDVLADGQPVQSPISLVSDVPGPATKLTHGSHQLWLIERGDRLGIRVRDFEAPARRQFRGLECFSWQSAWRKMARFEPHPPGTTLPITDVTGVTRPEPNPGSVVFQHAGRTYRLEALADAEAGDLFLLFQDATNGSTTYAPGRFLHAPYPDAAGRVVLDFNRAYNPPCAFTEYATCPRAPAENQLPFPVRAGEKKY